MYIVPPIKGQLTESPKELFYTICQQLFLSFPLIPISCLTAYVDQWIEKQFNLHIFNLQTLPAHWQHSSRAAHGGGNNLVKFQLHSASSWWCDIVTGSNR